MDVSSFLTGLVPVPSDVPQLGTSLTTPGASAGAVPFQPMAPASPMGDDAPNPAIMAGLQQLFAGSPPSGQATAPPSGQGAAMSVPMQGAGPANGFEDPLLTRQIQDLMQGKTSAMGAERDLFGQANQIRQNAFAQPLPMPVHPSLGTPDAVRLGLGLVLNAIMHGGGAGARNFIGGYGEGLQNQSNLLNQRNLQNFQRQGELANVQAQGLEQQGQLGVNQAESALSSAMQMRQIEQSNWYKNLTLQQKGATQALMRYNSAKTPQEMEAAKLQLGRWDPDQAAALDPARDWSTLQAKRMDDSLKALNQEIQGYVRQLGVLPQDVADTLNAKGDAIAGQYKDVPGFSPALVPRPPVGDETLRQQSLKEKQTEFAQRFGSVDVAVPVDMKVNGVMVKAGTTVQASPATMKAIQLMGQQDYLAKRLGQMAMQIQISKQNGDTAAANAQTSRMGLDLRSWIATQDEQAKAAKAAVDPNGKLAATIAGLQHEIGQMNSSNPNYQRARDQLDKLQGQYDYLRKTSGQTGEQAFRDLLTSPLFPGLAGLAADAMGPDILRLLPKSGQSGAPPAYAPGAGGVPGVDVSGRIGGGGAPRPVTVKVPAGWGVKGG